MSALEVSLAGPGDLAEARALLMDELVRISPHGYRPEWYADIEDLAGAYLEHPHQALIVAREVGGGLVGTAAVRHRLPPSPWVAARFRPEVTCELGRVAVAPASRRRGVATRLVEAARRWAVEDGFEAIHLHADAGNAGALAFWRGIATEITHGRTDGDEAVYFSLPVSLEVRRRAASHPGGYRVRPARPTDLPAARALMVRTFEEDYGYGFRPEIHGDLDDLRGNYLDHPRQQLAVAVDDVSGEVIAVGSVIDHPSFPRPRPDWLLDRFPRERTAELTRVFAAREHRRRGAARDIVEALRRWVVASGQFDALVLHTNTGRDGAEAFWRSMATELFDARPTVFNTVHFALPLDRPVPGAHPERIEDAGPRQEQT
ncbi:MAG: GNAT family N-acetyltransferase [Dehalococcoidia bacterium]